MSKRVARRIESPLVPAVVEPSSTLHVTPSLVTGQFTCDGPTITHVILLIDGVAHGGAPALAGADGRTCSFELPLPGYVLGASLDVLAAHSGRSVLDAPFNLAAARALRWGGWSVKAARIEGEFSVVGAAAPDDDSAIPVEIMSDGALYCRAFALPSSEADEAGRPYRFAADVPACRC